MLVTSIPPTAEPAAEAQPKAAQADGEGGLFAALLAQLAADTAPAPETEGGESETVADVVAEAMAGSAVEDIPEAETPEDAAPAPAAPALPEGMTSVAAPMLASAPAPLPAPVVWAPQPQLEQAPQQVAETAPEATTAKGTESVYAKDATPKPMRLATAEANAPAVSHVEMESPEPARPVLAQAAPAPEPEPAPQTPVTMTPAPATEHSAPAPDRAFSAAIATVMAAGDAEVSLDVPRTEEGEESAPEFKVVETRASYLKPQARGVLPPQDGLEETAPPDVPLQAASAAAAPEAEVAVAAPRAESAPEAKPAVQHTFVPEAKAPELAPQAAPVTPQRENVQVAAVPSAPAPVEVPVQELASASLKSVKQLIETGEQRMHLRINPESLGEMQIEVTRSGGDVQVRMTATSQAVRDLLDAQTHHLREALVREGFEAPRIQVTQSNTGNSTGFNTAQHGQHAQQQWQAGSQQGGGQGTWHRPRLAADTTQPPAARSIAAAPAQAGGATLNISV